MYCIKVKRKGFNYYTDYMERYFEKVAANHGYHLVKRREQAELWCFTFIGEPRLGGPKWIIFMSDVFSEITNEQLEVLSQLIAECFKSESVIETADEELDELIHMAKAYLKGECSFTITEEQCRKYGSPDPWFFSREQSAFDEPPFLTDGETDLKIVSYTPHCTSGDTFMLDVQNYGGVSKGLVITISYDYDPNNEIELENLMLVLPNNKNNMLWQRIPVFAIQTIAESRRVHTVDLPDFDIPEGVNIYSAKLCGKKKQDEADYRSITLKFVPCGNSNLINSMSVEIYPKEYPSKRVVWKNGIGIVR